MNKRGQKLITKEAIEIILSVIGIGMLVGLIVMLYSSLEKSNELDEAQATLDRIVDVSNSLSNGDKTSFIIYNPKKEATWGTNQYWIMSSWPVGDTKPNNCKTWEYCLCICANPTILSPSFQNFSDKCDETGICVKTSSETLILYNSKAYVDIKEVPLNINIAKGNDRIFIS